MQAARATVEVEWETETAEIEAICLLAYSLLCGAVVFEVGSEAVVNDAEADWQWCRRQRPASPSSPRSTVSPV